MARLRSERFKDGRSAYLAAVLDVLADGPKRVTDIANALKIRTGEATSYLERLSDVIVKQEEGTYRLEDQTFGLWIRWRRPGGSVMPMTLVGDAAEKEVAALLARLGFDLVYQSRASRGAFDLLATRGPHQLAIQVKRSKLPLRFDKPTWNRLIADAKQSGWVWLVAAVHYDGAVVFLDPAKVHLKKEARLTSAAAIENVMAWLSDQASGSK